MPVTYIRDAVGKIIGSQTTTANRVYTSGFATAKTVASYNPKNNTTLSIQDNKTVQGDQSIRFIKK